MNTLRKILLPALLGLAVLAVIGLLGSALVVYREASAIHPILGWLVIVLLVLGACLLFVYPVLRILRLPSAIVRPKELSGPKWNRFLERYAGRLLQSERILEDYPKVANLRNALDTAKIRRRSKEETGAITPSLDAEITEALAFLDGKAQRAICRHAAAVFAATAVSQSGRLDTAIVFSAQLRLVKEVAEIYYQRPHPRELLGLYANVGASAFVAGEIQDSELVAVLGAPVSAGLSGLIPVGGTDPLVSLLVNSLLDGSANALLTLRIGVLSSRYCGVRIEEGRRGMARSASLAAAKLLSGVVGQGAGRVAGATRKLMFGGAVRGTQRAAEGAATVGATVLEGVAKLAEKASAAARGVTHAAARPTSAILKETLRFWENVEAAVGGKEKKEESAPTP
jgi:uncharacterized membrane protein YcjF (UPF0283 family)